MQIKNALREALEVLARSAETPRPAAVRRSLKEEWLYATDLPGLMGEEALAAWIRSAGEQGWRVSREGGWLLLDHDIPDSLEGRYDGPFGEEAACCASLLKRRGGSGDGTGAKRRLVRAGEEGPEAYERVCRELHGEWAAALRKKEPLPVLPLDWFEKNS